MTLEFDLLVFRRMPARGCQRIRTVVGLVDRIDDDFIEESDDFLVGGLRLKRTRLQSRADSREREREEKQRMQNGRELLRRVLSHTPFDWQGAERTMSRNFLLGFAFQVFVRSKMTSTCVGFNRTDANGRVGAFVREGNERRTSIRAKFNEEK